MAGGGAAGFVGGFGEGLAQALLHNQERSDEKKKQATALEMQKFNALFPVFMQNSTGSDDEIASFMSQFPHLSASVTGGQTPGSGGGKSGGKNGTSPFAQIGHFFRTFGLHGIGGNPSIFGPHPIGNDLPSQGGIAGTLPRGGMKTVGSGQTPTVTSPVSSSVPSPLEADAIARRQQLGLPMASGAASTLTPTLTPTLSPDVSAAIAAGTPPPQEAAPPSLVVPPAAVPSIAAGTPPATTAASHVNTIFGIPILSPEQKIAREQTAQTAAFQGLMDRARSVVLPALKAVDPSATIWDAMEILDPKISLARTQRQAAAYHYGVDREAIARSVFGKNFGDLTSDEQAVVLDEETKRLELEANARGTGKAAAAYNAPMTAEQAQSTGAPVGTSSADLAGQRVAPMTQQEVHQQDLVLRSDVDRIKQLIAVLPGEKDPGLGQLAPGAWFAVRSRMNTPSPIVDPATGQPRSYRSALAQLQAAVDNTVSQLARARGNRGAQTERDAERAYNALVQLQAGFRNPFGGDTRESAAVRIDEALGALDRVIAIGAPPVPNPKAPGAKGSTAAKGSPAPTAPTTPTAPKGLGGIQMDDKGNLYDAKGNLIQAVQ